MEQFIVLTPPTVEPVSLSDTKAYLRVDFGDDDALLATLISRARSLCEMITGRAWGYQQIQTVYTIERPEGGTVSGPIMRGPSWYEYNQQIGANPFGAAQFYYDLPMPPVDRVLPVTMEYKVVAFDPWKTFPQFTNIDGSTNTWLDYAQEPARLYVMDPVTSNFWRFTYWCGFGNANTSPLPFDMKQALMECIAYLYDYREGEDFPDALKAKLLSKRVASAWI
jgi:Phage gp6-like head-tail connector protein